MEPTAYELAFWKCFAIPKTEETHFRLPTETHP